MANDRYFLRCKTCGGYTNLAKYYPTLARYGYNTEDFVTRHMLSCIDGYPIDLDDQMIFEVLSEQGMADMQWAGEHEKG